PFDVRRLPGVGPKAEQRLVGAGVETIGALARLGDSDLRRLLPGSVGRLLRDRAKGIDPRGLELQTERISISIENTFERDLTDRALTARPGALRLVGVGVSGLASHRQLALV